MLKKHPILIGLACLPFTASASVNYLDLEGIANTIFCEKESRCDDTVMKNEDGDTGGFSVDGTLLPADALRDEDQQRGMIAASLYIKENGDVASLPSAMEVERSIQSTNTQSAERRKVLPVKLFPAPDITPRAKQVVISVK